jgi:DNA-binding NarL/FixJ family response regulator
MMAPESRKIRRAAARRRPLRVLILSNHPLIRAGLRKVLEGADFACVVSEAAAGLGVRDAVGETVPDIALLDLDACDAENLLAIAKVVHEGGPARLLALASECPPEMRRRLVEIGAMGCVRKEDSAEAFLTAVDRVARGEVWFDRSTLSEFVAELHESRARDDVPVEAAGIETLTHRECEIVENVALGLTNKETARQLFISEVTVRHHLTSIYSKLGIANRQQLMLYAFRRGLVPPPGRAAG